MLDKESANKVAQMAQDGLARAIIPAHTMYDGDMAADITAIGSLAAETLAAAVVRAVRAASSAGGYSAVRDIGAGGDSDRR